MIQRAPTYQNNESLIAMTDPFPERRQNRPDERHETQREEEIPVYSILRNMLLFSAD
jgi:hypothetical protein